MKYAKKQKKKTWSHHMYHFLTERFDANLKVVSNIYACEMQRPSLICCNPVHLQELFGIIDLFHLFGVPLVMHGYIKTWLHPSRSGSLVVVGIPFPLLSLLFYTLLGLRETQGIIYIWLLYYFYRRVCRGLFPISNLWRGAPRNTYSSQ